MADHIAGYVAACHWKDIEERLDPPWHDFHEYVRSKTDFAESTSGWSNMLLAFSGNDEAKALEVFFEFFDDFRAKAKV